MKTKGRRRSRNVQDKRNMGAVGNAVDATSHVLTQSGRGWAQMGREVMKSFSGITKTPVHPIAKQTGYPKRKK